MRPLGTVVGHTTRDSACVLAFFEASANDRARLVFDDDRGIPISLDLELAAATPYALARFELNGITGGVVRYAVESYPSTVAPPPAQQVLGGAVCSFRTLPDRPPKIALVSCNHVDNHAFPKERRGAMWRRLGQLVARGEVDLIVHAGDQIYGDDPPPGWKAEDERVSAYRRHYVDTWTHPDVAAVLSSCPNLMMWDDHEIYDGWGSNDGDETEAARSRFAAAAQAFTEFQAALSPRDRFASGFGWAFEHPGLALLALDGRSQRAWRTHAVLGKPQLDELSKRLDTLATRELKHLFVLLGTPIVYVPVIAGEKLTSLLSPNSLDDVRDAWTASHNREECRRLLMLLFDFAARSPGTQVTVLAGDVHVGTLAQIETQLEFGPARRRPRLYQVTSSGIGRPPPSGISAFMLKLLTGGGEQALLHQDIVGHLRTISGSDHEYLVQERNFAVLDVGDGAGGWDKNGHLHVHFHTEHSPDSVLEQLLPKLN